MEFIDVMDANAWKKLDERLLLVEDVRRLGKVLESRHCEIYGSVNKLLGKSSNLLWVMRSGQLPLVPNKLQDLERIYRQVGHGKRRTHIHQEPHRRAKGCQ